MNKYLFVDFNNGHKITYHPFLSNVDLSNEEAKELQLKAYPEALRTGTRVAHIMTIIEEMSGKVANYIHPEYGIEVHIICNPDLNQWHVIEGISGNY